MTPHIFLFHGPDTYSSSNKIRTWLSEFAKKHGVHNSVIVDCATRDPEPVVILRNFLGIHSLFGFTKLLVLRNVWEKEAKPVAEYLVEHLATLPSTYFIVIHAEQADARTSLMKKIIELEKSGRASLEHYAIPTGQNLSSWIQDHAGRHGGTISNDALHYFTSLLEGTGFKDAPTYNLWTASHEIEKLISFADGRTIDRNDIDLLVSRPLNAHVFDLVDALLAQNSKESYRILHELISEHSSQTKSQGFGIISLLKNQFRQLLIVKDLGTTLSDAEIARALSWNPKRLWVVRKKIDRISCDRLKKLYSTILERESGFLFSRCSTRTTLDLTIKQLLS